MFEPEVPVPDPEADAYWNPHPARCSHEGCRNILDMRGDGKGRCSVHGEVTAIYHETQNFEFPKEDEQ